MKALRVLLDTADGLRGLAMRASPLGTLVSIPLARAARAVDGAPGRGDSTLLSRTLRSRVVT